MTPLNDTPQPTNQSQKNGFAVDPIQATFRGGKHEPLHTWYPYLEGYSPEFVREVISTYAPHAQHIIDPFAGTGTTPLTVMQMGRKGFYCEINPVLRFLIQTKVKAYLADKDARKRVTSRLKALADQLEPTFLASSEDPGLIQTYSNTFGKSTFFDAETRSLVLRARTVVDTLHEEQSLLSDLFCVSVLGTIVASSNLIRAGDVKYRRSEAEWNKRIPFLTGVRQRLIRVASDLETVPIYTNKPCLLTDDARAIPIDDPIRLDALVTSPPYLNGTNYFRNTKMELWFLRELKTKKDLTDFRYKAVVAGINNVTNRKIGSIVPEPIKPVVRQLEKVAYDQRIPKMVVGYFQDMERIFDNIRAVLAEDSMIAVDIGDSIYAGVHVETDKLLAQLLELLGYELIDRVLLRRRSSRNKMEVSQVLLVFKYRGTTI